MKTINSLQWIIMALLGVVLFVCIRGSLQRPSVLYNRERITEIRNDSVQHWKDEAGREHGRVQLAESNLATLQAYYGPLIDSVTKSLKIQGGKLDNLAAIGNRTVGTVRPHVDSVVIRDARYPHFTYDDRWLKLDGVLAADSPFIHYQTFDSLIVTTYRKKKWLLGRSTTYLDAYCLNPASHITGLTGLKVTDPRPKRFGIGPFIGYGFTGQGWQPAAGISLQYSLVKF